MKSKSGRIKMKLLLLPVFASMLVGCVTSNTTTELARQELFWPSAPFEPRIQWVGEIRDRQDAGIKKSFWNQLVEMIAGIKKDVIGKPYGIYADAGKRLFVADTGRAVVHEFNIGENEYSIIGNHDKRVLQTPIALTGDDAENLYITDSTAGMVFRYNIREKNLASFIAAGKLRQPTGIAFHRSKRLLYVTDTASHFVVVFDMQGQERFRIGSRGEKQGYFNYPTDLWLDATGDLYVTDALNARIQVFSSDGRFLRMFGSAGDSAGYFAKPKGVAVDSEGHIYVSDALQDSIQIFDKTGALMLAFGESGNGAGQFWMPSGLFIDSSDTIYISDSYNQRIQMFRYLKSSEEKPELKVPESSGRGKKTVATN